MNLLLSSFIVLAYFNAVWQIMLWGYDLLHPVLGFMLVFFFPVIAGVAIYLVTYERLAEGWVGPVVASTVLFPILYCAAYATRAPDYVKYIHSGRDVFSGRPVEMDDSNHLYYTLESSLIKPDEFGTAYHSNKPRQSTTTYSKYFALPVYDAGTGERQDAWICSSVAKGIPIDNGAAGPYGLSETELKDAFGTGIIHGRKIVESNCSRAVANYLEKNGLPAIERPLILDLEKETPEEYYRRAKLHFGILTGLLNAFFIVFFAFVYRANKGV